MPGQRKSSPAKQHEKRPSNISKAPIASPSKTSTVGQVSERQEFLQNEISQFLSDLVSSPNVQANLDVLNRLKQLITTSTGFASIPETLKILLTHYGTFKQLYEKKADSQVKKTLANLVSFIATSQPDNSKGDILRYFLLGSNDRVDQWGIAYVRDLTKDITERWKKDTLDQENKSSLNKVVLTCAKYYIGQNSEVEACDILIDTQQLDQLQSLVVVDDVCSKVCHYIATCAPNLPEPENKNSLYCVLNLWLKFGHFVEALFVAIDLQSVTIIEKIFRMCADVSLQKQMAFILARHNIPIDSKCTKPEVAQLWGNSLLHQHFIMVAQKLDIMAPKVLDEILKGKKQAKKQPVSQEMQRFALTASSLANGFLNAAFGSDKLLLGEKGPLIEQHQEFDKISATASLGLLYLWNSKEGLGKIDKYLYMNDANVKAGALIACGLVNCTVKCPFDTAFLLLGDYLANSSMEIQLGATMGLALAYVGTNHSKAIKSLLGRVQEKKTEAFIAGMGAISCGLIANSTCDGSVISILIDTLTTDQHRDLSSKATRNIVHGIGLCAMGKVEMLPTLMEAIQVIPSVPVRQYLKLFIEVCAYVGSSNILKIQELLKLCNDESAKQKEKKLKEASDSKRSRSSSAGQASNEDLLKMVAVLGIGLISIGDDLNIQMVTRHLNCLLQTGDPHMQSAVILTIALIYMSKPQLSILELLSKYSHNSDVTVSAHSILALGLVGAGTNNAKVSKLLADLADLSLNQRSALSQFVIKISQGLLHLGKGSLTLSCQLEGRLIRHSSISGVLALMLQLLTDHADSLLKRHYLFYFLACAIRPKSMITLDADTLNSVSVPVRVGQPVDTTGQAGTPRTVIGFQSFDTPVLLSANEKAELATEDYIPLNTFLEGCVLLKRKPQQPSK